MLRSGAVLAFVALVRCKQISLRNVGAGTLRRLHEMGCFAADGPLVGLGVMTPEIEPGVAQLAFLHVSQAYRRLGIASELVDRLVDWAREAGAREIYVSATPGESAVSFYQRAGFRITDRPNPALLALEPEDIHLRRPL